MYDNSSEEFKRDWIPEGFQIRKIRRPRKNTPKWAQSHTALAMHILGKKGLLRLRIAYLYWMADLNAREIAETLNKSEEYIRNVIKKLRRKRVLKAPTTNTI